MDVLRQSANGEINADSTGTSWHYRDLREDSRPSVLLATQALTLPGMHTVSAHCLLVKTVRWFNSHQEPLPRKNCLHTEGRQAKWWGGKCSRVWQSHAPAPVDELALPPTAYLHPLRKTREGRDEREESRCTGTLRNSSSSSNRSRQNSKIHWNERLRAPCRNRTSL